MFIQSPPSYGIVALPRTRETKAEVNTNNKKKSKDSMKPEKHRDLISICKKWKRPRSTVKESKIAKH